jgi:hypothetical protein
VTGRIANSLLSRLRSTLRGSSADGGGPAEPTPRQPLLTRRSGIALGLILLLGLAIRVVLVARAPAFIIPVDSGDFFLAGWELGQRGEFPLPVKRAPGYPFFLAGATSLVGPNLEAVVALQHLLGLASIVLVYLLGALAFGRPAGLLAALGTALNGGLLLIEHSIMSEALFAPLLPLALVAVLVALRQRRLPLFMLAGLALGAAALTRPTGQTVLPLALVALVLALPSWRRRLLAAGVLCLGFALVVSPWVLRNKAVHGVTAISSGMGDALFSRTRRHDLGFDYRDRTKEKLEREQAHIRNRVFELARTHRLSREMRAALQDEFGLTNLQADAALRDASLLVIRQEPGYYLLGTAGWFAKLLLGFEKPLDDFWETRTKPKHTKDWPDEAMFVFGDSSRWTDGEDAAIVNAVTSTYEDHRLGGPLMAVLLLLGAIRGVVGWRQGFWLLPAVLASQLLLYVAIDGPLFRYRTQLQPLITLVAAGGLTWLLALVWSRVGAAGLRLPGRWRTAPAESMPANARTVDAT